MKIAVTGTAEMQGKSCSSVFNSQHTPATSNAKVAIWVTLRWVAGLLQVMKDVNLLLKRSIETFRIT